MNCALTPGSSPGQALALSRRAGEGIECCIERPRFEGRSSGVLFFFLGSRVRGNDGGVRGNDGGVRRNDVGVVGNDVGVGGNGVRIARLRY